jgi:chemotaxis protein MotA
VNKVDKGSVGGLLVAAGAVVCGLLLEGGSIAQIVQPTAAMIVFGGTLGAVMLQFPLSAVVASFTALATVFFGARVDAGSRVEQLVRFAVKARRGGIVALDSEMSHVEDEFLKRCLMLAVDGTESRELRNIMELELDNKAEWEEQIPQVFESAGGFSPTVGIIGAVLGLIQVMHHLGNIDEVGRGIAVAFVSTVYGVAAANLFFLPSAGKLRIRLRQAQVVREMTVEGVISILDGMNPRMLEAKLLGFILEPEPETRIRSSEVSS